MRAKARMPTQRYKLTIAYRGTRYHGWQTQPALPSYKGETPADGEGIPTIQETVARALTSVVRHPLILSGSSRTDARVHAKILGENCYGPAKLSMVTDWLAKSGLSRGHVRFYSDHASDAPVFEWADEPVAVNPHDRLRRLAAERGWTVEDWS